MDAGSGKLVGMSVLPRHLSSKDDSEYETLEAHSEIEPQLFLLTKKVCIALLYAGNLHL
jgi:hypothetical protein